MVTSLGDALRVTVTPPLGAAEVRVTVHESVEGGVTLAELHERLFKPEDVTGGLTVKDAVLLTLE